MERACVNVDNIPVTIELIRREGAQALRYIDQRLLPAELRIVETGDWRQVVCAIEELAVRGAPAIGLAGASALALWVSGAQELGGIEEAADRIASARPTAVNLKWAVERALKVAVQHAGEGQAAVADALYKLVKEMEADDERTNRAIGSYGSALIPAGSRILTHCNAGSLATRHYGTALGVVYAAAQQGKVTRVYADETRPVGQGSRLTVWELSRAGVPVTLICDNMAATLMAQGLVDAVVVGADRIARNGDTANKIGTYGVAVLAREHGVPFYVAAPMSSVDPLIGDGSAIVIEQRGACEVLPVPLEGVDVYNPAFDVTPARYITKIVTELGSFSPEELASRL